MSSFLGRRGGGGGALKNVLKFNDKYWYGDYRIIKLQLPSFCTFNEGADEKEKNEVFEHHSGT